MIETILLPSDFSATAVNAGIYAIELAQQVGAKKIVVYHTYDAASVSDPMVSYTQKIVTEPFRQKSAAQLNEFIDKLNAKNKSSIVIEAFHSYADLKDALNELIASTGAQLIVMGITGGGVFKETFIGSNSVNVAKSTNIPVIIVPTETSFSPISNILLLSDLNNVEDTTPTEAIKNILDASKAKLHVLNVTDNTEKAEASSDKQQLDKLFEAYNPNFSFMSNPDFVGAVDWFVKEKGIDLVIVIPKKHGLFETLFKFNHTKTLAFHGKVPLMAVKK
ncbi:MAG TPA: universal stress protein [Chitinophagaceae bacterium]|nr:universal stress protein [Chitinophagaceae bacterium]HMZ45330.1 universal stress protein [Chitinophagaceae bacterium]HNN30738.1 universal stress protein [Chitinophagaceae bacterium]